MTNLIDYKAPRDRFLSVDHLPGKQFDFIFVTGDAYVDHPSFGPALLGRLLEDQGYRVGVLAQPDWHSCDDFRRLGRPRLAFLVSAGNMDSLVANYTVTGKPRRQDAYSPSGVGGKRPDRATLVYCTRLREAFKDIDIILGGIEASLRRFAHYDYWSDSLRRSILIDSKADLLLYGMGERALLEVARQLDRGTRARNITNVAGTAWKYRTTNTDLQEHLKAFPGRALHDLPSWDDLKDSAMGTEAYARSFREQHRNTDALNADILAESYGPWRVIQNPPALPLEEESFDRLYELPYTRTFHPDYLDQGGVPAIEEVRFSLVSNRGCFGGCTFCALTYHQGRRIQSRSTASLLREARLLTSLPGFKGYIHDVGGPTANFFRPACEKQLHRGVCKDRQCLVPKPCRELRADHRDYLEVLRALRAVAGVKKVFVRSGLRFDYVLLDRDETFLKELCSSHISGRLKVAPEHISAHALEAMGKPGAAVYQRFQERYREINRSLGLPQQLIPYFISSHPGTSLADAVELAEYFHASRISPEQVQDFYPTPGTPATCMYYTGIDPRTGKKVPSAKTPREKAMQRALLQYRDPKNWHRVREALQEAHREDLIGWKKHCLIPPEPPGKNQRTGKPPGGSSPPGQGRRTKPGPEPTQKGKAKKTHSPRRSSSRGRGRP
ncbi:uncharacterized radical SAM protein YgiQ [Alkalispirochaeta americana]|uniref:Uncharacterized radical SAM protein YgiQ n=1 Tax=Alkalispirochaeta americana TaxID=159291 RepID=A0A1N6T443_9SPIO|nr:YgiQ family radical SAM protein [Alkalispirochaeta americana]SIQ47997.1 uncharacterized radical SAM protein YgiQ [Alkalispirochaeta americana]